MKKNLFISVVLISLLNLSCNSFLEDKDMKRFEDEQQTIISYTKKLNLPFERHSSGIHFLKTRKNNAVTAKSPLVGEEVTLHFVRYILDGAKLDSTSTLQNKPVVSTFTPANFNNLAGFLYSIEILKNGEKGIFLIPSSLMYGGSTGNGIPANALFRIDIDLLKVRSEDDQIEEYVKANKLEVAEKTTTNMRYIKVTNNPNGVAMNAGRTATVKYAGTFLSGKAFDSGEFQTVIGDAGLIKGFNEALLKMKVGEKAKFIMPSAIGYGANGSASIPPFSPLIFDLEITK